MATCRACGGVLGRDCFNEADCMAISESQQQDVQYKAQMYDQLKAEFDESLMHLKKVIDLLINYPVDDTLDSDFVKAQMFHFKNTIHAAEKPQEVQQDEDLPF